MRENSDELFIAAAAHHYARSIGVEDPAAIARTSASINSSHFVIVDRVLSTLDLIPNLLSHPKFVRRQPAMRLSACTWCIRSGRGLATRDWAIAAS
jgi:hypothetical protein